MEDLWADQAVEDDIFVYTGGQAPQHVKNVIVDRSVKEIEEHAFGLCPNLQYVVFHRGVLRVKRWAFSASKLTQIHMPGVQVIETYAFVGCQALRNVTMPSVRILGEKAFHGCKSIELLDLPRLEETSFRTFEGCLSLRQITMPLIKTIGDGTFCGCEQLEELDLPVILERIGIDAAMRCMNLRRIAIPLKSDMLCSVVYNDYSERYCQFDDCGRLTTVDLVGGIHQTVSSLLLECWRDEMREEINRINLILPNSTGDKSLIIQTWIESLIKRIESYKVGHQNILKWATHVLELALWKVKIDENEEEGDDLFTRNEIRVKSGSSAVIRNVLPFLRLA